MIDKKLSVSVLSDDESELNASIVFDELLRSPELALSIVQENQDAPNPRLRRRIHQLASILNRRQVEENFNKLLEDKNSTNWDVCAAINVVLDAQCSALQLDELLRTVAKNYIGKIHGTQTFQQILRMIGLNPEVGEEMYLTQYLLSDILLSYSGHSLPMAVIAQRIGQLCGWNTTLGLMESVPCLRDANFYVIRPTVSWEIVHPKVEDFVPISKKNLAVELLSCISTAAYLDQVTSTYTEAQALLDSVLNSDG